MTNENRTETLLRTLEVLAELNAGGYRCNTEISDCLRELKVATGYKAKPSDFSTEDLLAELNTRSGFYAFGDYHTAEGRTFDNITITSERTGETEKFHGAPLYFTQYKPKDVRL